MGEHDGRTASSRGVPGGVVLGLVLTSTMAVGTLAPFALAALAPFILDDLEFSRTQYGSLITVYFLVGALISPSVGSVVDRLGGWLMMLVLIVVSVVSFAVMAGVPSYLWLMVAMVLAGLANALVNPTTNQVIGAHVTPGRRGVIVGVKQSGVQAGAALSGLALPALAVLLGWRPSLLVCAAVTAALAVLAWVVRPPAHRGHRAVTREPVRWAGSQVRWLVVYAFLMGAGVAVANTYVVLFAHEGLELSEAWAGRTLGVLGAASVVARILWARRAERTANPSRALTQIAGIAAVSSGLFWLAPAMGGQAALWTAVLLVGASAAAWNSVGMLAVIDGNDGATMGRASGNVLAGFFAGNVVSPAAVGALVDRTGSYEPAWAVTVAIFVAAGVVAAGQQRRVRRAAQPDSGAERTGR